MSALGHQRTLKRLQPMSALPPKADIKTQSRDVRFVPKADIDRPSFDHSDLSSRRQLMISDRPHSRKYNPKDRAFGVAGRDDQLASVTLDDHPANSQSQ